MSSSAGQPLRSVSGWPQSAVVGLGESAGESVAWVFHGRTWLSTVKGRNVMGGSESRTVGTENRVRRAMVTVIGEPSRWIGRAWTTKEGEGREEVDKERSNGQITTMTTVLSLGINEEKKGGGGGDVG